MVVEVDGVFCNGGESESGDGGSSEVEEEDEGNIEDLKGLLDCGGVMVVGIRQRGFNAMGDGGWYGWFRYVAMMALLYVNWLRLASPSSRRYRCTGRSVSRKYGVRGLYYRCFVRD
jgi:hypothetical protein